MPFTTLPKTTCRPSSQLVFHGGDEELAAVGVGSRVRHGEPAGPFVLQLEVFVLEFGAVDALPARSVAVGEVAALQHEVFDDPVEAAAFVAESFGPEGEFVEVVHSFWH